MALTWLTAAATPAAAAAQTRCEQQPRDFVHLTVVTTALHSIAQVSMANANRLILSNTLLLFFLFYSVIYN